MRIVATARDQIIGRRSEQQDVLAEGIARLSDGHQSRLIVIADGMGGHNGGAIAAQTAVTAFLTYCEGGAWDNFSTLLQNALLSANRAIGEYSRERRGLADMGCTLVAAVFDGPRLFHISIGDSLVVRVADAGLERINADHSMAPLIDAKVIRGEMTLEEARNHPQRSVLRAALTGRPLSLIDDGLSLLSDGDVILLATDGLLSLSDARILDIIKDKSAAKPDTMVAKMLDEIEGLDMSDQDNCSIAIAVMAPALPRTLKRRALFRGAHQWLTVAIITAGLTLAVGAWLILSDNLKLDTDLAESRAPDVQAEVILPQTPVRRPGVEAPPQISSPQSASPRSASGPKAPEPVGAQIPNPAKPSVTALTSPIKKEEQEGETAKAASINLDPPQIPYEKVGRELEDSPIGRASDMVGASGSSKRQTGPQ